MTHTKESILNLIDSSDEAVARGLVALYERQTSDEQAALTTKHLNGVGFNYRDSEIGSSFARQIQNWLSIPVSQRRFPKPLSDRQMSCGRRLLRKYSRQLAEIANAKEQPVVDTQPDLEDELAAEEAYENHMEMQAEQAWEDHQMRMVYCR